VTASLHTIARLNRERLMTASDLADRWQVKKSLVYQLSRTGQIPTIRLGERYVRFSIDAIREFESTGGTQAVAPTRR
jgi:predicted DNA-binding transcriptional regulator AlpA